MAGVEYWIDPHATTAPFMPTIVSLAASTAKTVAQVGVPSTTDIMVLAWGVSYDGTTGTNTPVQCQLADTDVAATVTAFTPDPWGNVLQAASLCVGGTAATGYNASAEGTIGSIIPRGHGFCHPQAGYELWYPEGHNPRIASSRFLRLRCLATQAVDVLPFIIWAEPAV